MRSRDSKPRQSRSKAEWRRVVRETQETVSRTTGDDEGSLLTRGTALTDLGGAFIALGRYSEALSPLAEASATLARVSSGRKYTVAAEAQRADALIMLGRITEGLQIVERLTDSSAPLEFRPEFLPALWRLRFSLLGNTLGRWSELAAVAASAHARFAELPDLLARRTAAWSLLALAEANAKLGNPQLGASQYDKLLQRYQGDDDPVVLEALAQAREITGRDDILRGRAALPRDLESRGVAGAQELSQAVTDDVHAEAADTAIAHARRLSAWLEVEADPELVSDLADHALHAAKSLLTLGDGGVAAGAAADVLEAVTSRLRFDDKDSDGETLVEAQFHKAGALALAGDADAGNRAMEQLCDMGVPALGILARLAERSASSELEADRASALGMLIARVGILVRAGREAEATEQLEALLKQFADDQSTRVRALVASLRDDAR
jgi:tetratricopeptide (TPR) repeat protein